MPSCRPIPAYVWEWSVLKSAQDTRVFGQTDWTVSNVWLRWLSEWRTHRRRCNEEAPGNATNGKSNELSRHDEHPLVLRRIEFSWATRRTRDGRAYIWNCRIGYSILVGPQRYRLHTHSVHRLLPLLWLGPKGIVQILRKFSEETKNWYDWVQHLVQ